MEKGCPLEPLTGQKKVLLTGGFGYLGGRLAQALAVDGYSVLLGTSKQRLSPTWLPEAKTVLIDWKDSKALGHACDGVDFLIHTAGMNAACCSRDPERALEYNGGNTVRLAEAAATNNVSRFIYFSTAHVYASPLCGVITENTCPQNLHPYATSHLAGENAVLYAGANSDMKSLVLRLSNCFGRPAHKTVNCWMLLVNDLCRQAVEKRSLTVKGNGRQQRDFIGIDQLCGDVKAILANTSAPTGVLNVSTGISESVKNMASLVQQRCEMVLGFSPDLILDDFDLTSYPVNLVIQRSEAIRKIQKPVDFAGEIDKLLTYCANEFSLIPK